MKRFHVNVAVADLALSRRFYSMLFAAEPAVAKDDYAKWMLDDPRLNFSITQSREKKGIQHVGLQTDSLQELGEIQDRLRQADAATFDQPLTECCYARSSKTWLRDPDDVAWETFFTHGQITHYGAELSETAGEAARSSEATGASTKRCCA
jgi:predicted lactoylglutathione lyase